MDEAGRTLLMATFGAVKTTALGLGVCGVLETGKVHDLRLEAHGHPPVRPHEAGTALVCIPRERARAKHHRHRPLTSRAARRAKLQTSCSRRAWPAT